MMDMNRGLPTTLALPSNQVYCTLLLVGSTLVTKATLYVCKNLLTNFSISFPFLACKFPAIKYSDLLLKNLSGVVSGED